MKTQPMDVVVGGSYEIGGGRVIVTAVKPKGRGWYVEYRPSAFYDTPTATTRIGLEPFRRMAGINQREAA